MTKCALIITNKVEACNLFALIWKTINQKFIRLIKKEIYNYQTIELEKDNIELRIINLENLKEDTRSIKDIENCIKWIIKENINVIAFDNEVFNRYKENILEMISGTSIQLCLGENLYFSILIPTLKKLLKSKGLDISQVDIVIVADQNSGDEIKLIKYFSPYVKYLTVIGNNDERIKQVVDYVYNINGVSIRICPQLKENINEFGLIINLSNTLVDLQRLKKHQNIVILEPKNRTIKADTNISILKDIRINNGLEFITTMNLSNDCILKISEMYLLDKMNMNSLYSREASEDEIKDIYNCFKDNKFKISSLEGINI